MEHPHFEAATSWADAATRLSFRPLVPAVTAGQPLVGLRIHVRDHRQRVLAVEARSLEAHYGSFVLAQAWKGPDEARRQVREVRFGRHQSDARVAGREARVYEAGPEVPPDDPDGRSPAVVVWHDAGVLYLVASADLPSPALVEIAASCYA